GVGRQLLLRARARLRVLGGPTGARARVVRAVGLALRIQRGRGDRAGAGGRGRAAGPGARAPHALGAAHGLELVAGDPARRRGAVRRASLLLTPGLTAGARPPCAGTLREGVVASLALVPSVFVYATVFGGLALPPP